MLKRISLDNVDENIREFLRQLKLEEDQYILEMEGKPLMGVVPVWQVEDIKLRKQELLDMLKEIWAKTREIPEATIEEEVTQAVKAVRKGL